MPLVQQIVEVGGAERRLLVAAPSGAPKRIIVSMHGSTSTPDRQAMLSRMPKLAGEGALVAFPQGSIPTRRGGWEWDLDSDVEFLDTAVDHLRRTYEAPTAPLAMTGMSGGARMASRFASTGRNRTHVLGAVAGLRLPATEHLEHPVRVVAFHGTRDKINPFAGGSTPRWQESVTDAAEGWAQANGHSKDPEETQVSADLTRRTYGPEDGPGAVTLWVARGAGHTWPGTRLPGLIRLYLGRVCMEVDATAEITNALATV